MRLSQTLDAKLVLISPSVDGRDELFQKFGEVFRKAGLVSQGAIVAERLREREAILSTGIGRGVAIPHAQIQGLGKIAMAVSIHPDGISYPALDENPVRLVFCLIGDADTAADHLAGLARLARIARKGDALEDLILAQSGEDFIEKLSHLEED